MLANSVVATVLVLLHAWVLVYGAEKEEEECFSLGRRAGDVLVVGFVAYVYPGRSIDCQWLGLAIVLT